MFRFDSSSKLGHGCVCFAKSAPPTRIRANSPPPARFLTAWTTSVPICLGPRPGMSHISPAGNAPIARSCFRLSASTTPRERQGRRTATNRGQRGWDRLPLGSPTPPAISHAKLHTIAAGKGLTPKAALRIKTVASTFLSAASKRNFHHSRSGATGCTGMFNICPSEADRSGHRHNHPMAVGVSILRSMCCRTRQV